MSGEAGEGVAVGGSMTLEKRATGGGGESGPEGEHGEAVGSEGRFHGENRWGSFPGDPGLALFLPVPRPMVAGGVVRDAAPRSTAGR